MGPKRRQRRRTFPAPPSLSRKVGTRDPKLKLIVICEGGNTEPDYLRRFANDHSNNLVDVVVVPHAGEPRAVIEAAIHRKRAEQKSAKITQDSFDKNFQVWGVFDRDTHERFYEALDLARAHGIGVAVSNPCTELWALLHLGECDAEMTSADAQRRLRRKMPGYDHANGALFDYEMMRSEYAGARARAIRQYERREQEGNPGGNPSTTMYRMLDLIIENGKDE